jgi:hypothetical protein
MSDRCQALALGLLRDELFRAPAPRTLTALRDFADAMRADLGAYLGPTEHLALQALHGYVGKRPDMTDRQLGVRLTKESSWHLVAYHALTLTDFARSQARSTSTNH